MQFQTTIGLLASLALCSCLNSHSEEKSSSSSSTSSSSADSSALSSSSDLPLSSGEVSSSSSSSTPASYAVLSSPQEALKRVVGYVPTYRDAQAITSGPYFNILTHANISFVNPDDTNMNFAKARNSGSWKKTIAALRPHQDQGLKLMASIGGAAAPAWIATLIKPEHREAFVDSLISFMDSEKLDGLDIDLEGTLVSDTVNYNPFVRLLADKVHAKNKLVTAAVAGWQISAYASSSLAKLDFINLMAYDYTGPWAPKGVGPHSSYTRSIADLQNFSAKEGVGKDRITLGVPFYAHQFYTESGVKAGNSVGFGELLDLYPQALDLDSIGTRNTIEGIYFYNGRITIRDKTLKAREYGGIMIWELGQDATGDNSLLKVIAEHAK